MRVVNLRDERRRRRPVPHAAKLMSAAEALWQLRHDHECVLFIPTDDVMDRIGPAFEAVMEVVLDLTEQKRSS